MQSALSHSLLDYPTTLKLSSKFKKDYAQKELTDEERAVVIFKDKAKKIQIFLSSNPIITTKYDSSFSQTGLLYNHYRFSISKISINIKKSDSLISPFVGYIDLSYATDTNKECGDVISQVTQNSEKHYLGFSTYENAMAHRNNCFHPRGYGSYIYPPEDIQLIFAYQDGRWVFKDVITHNNKPRSSFYTPNVRNELLLAALGQPEPGWYKLKDNQAWEDSIK
jgi:hypothetical protein